MWASIPCASCRCAPASEGSTSGCGSPCPPPELSATSSATPQPCACSALACGTGGSTARQSGTTSQHSTPPPGVEPWISLWRDSHVSRSASPENAERTPTSGGCGTTLPGSMPIVVRNGSRWKTSGDLFPSASTEFSGRWPTSGALRNGCVYERPRSVPPIGVTGGSAWPTASATDHKGASKPGQRRRQLDSVAEHWPTARATDGTKGGPNQRGSSGDLMLPSAASKWATPSAHDCRGERSAEALAAARARAGGGMSNLHEQAPMWATPTAGDAKGSRTLETNAAHPGLSLTDMTQRGRLDLRPATSGSESSEPGQTSRPRLRLNPLFVEWLMGWPIGWTSVARLGSDCPVTAWSRCRPAPPLPSCSGD